MVRPPGLPLVGQVAAGQPILAEENVEDYVQTPQVAGGEEGEYLLRVRGESMKDAGILEGDLVVVSPQDTAHDGEIVVALVGEEATVKTFYRESDHIRLQPENDDHGADPHARGAHPRQSRRPHAEHVMTVLVAERIVRPPSLFGPGPAGRRGGRAR